VTTNDASDDPRHWRVRQRRLALDAEPWLKVWKEDVQLPDERIVEGFVTIEMPDFVVIVATTPRGEILTQRGYKHGPGRVCLSLPAGFIEPGEDSLDAAMRELREETGYQANRWDALGHFVNDGNRGSGSGHLYLARDATQVAEPNSGDLETVTIELMSLDSLLRAIQAGEVGDIPNAAAIGLAAVRLNRESGNVDDEVRAEG
jgi:ADP-ribose pyrophosphatase